MKIYLTFYSVSSWSISLLFDDMYDFSDSFFILRLRQTVLPWYFFFTSMLQPWTGVLSVLQCLKLVVCVTLTRRRHTQSLIWSNRSAHIHCVVLDYPTPGQLQINQPCLTVSLCLSLFPVGSVDKVGQARMRNMNRIASWLPYTKKQERKADL